MSGYKGLVITHGGRAHRDEFLACCLILNHEWSCARKADVERRNPLVTEMRNHLIWVVDVGREHSPSLRNFDHHQPDPALDQFCALDLVGRHLYGEDAWEMYRRANRWLAVTGTHDNSGADAAAESLQISRAVYSAMISPIERQMLWQFGSHDTVAYDSGLSYFMRGTGRMLHFDITGAEVDVAALPSPESWGAITVWDLRTLEDLHAHGSSSALNQVAAEHGVDLIIGKSRSQDAVSLYRMPNTKVQVNLSLLTGEPEVSFAHKGGFFAVVLKEVSADRLRHLVALSVSEPQ